MNLCYKEKYYTNMAKNSRNISGNQRQVFKWNMLHISGNKPENAEKVLKYLPLENGVESPEADYACVDRKKKVLLLKPCPIIFES